MSTKRKEPTITLTNSQGIVLNNDVIRNIYNTIKNETEFSQFIFRQNQTWKRINKCQAYESNIVCFTVNDNYYYVKLIKSYNTIVAMYMRDYDCLISFGRYSRTTYQHIIKFTHNHKTIINAEFNMEYENWF